MFFSLVTCSIIQLQIFPFYVFFYLFFSHIYFITSFSRKLNFITLNSSISIPFIFIIFLITKITTLHQLLFIFILLFFSKFKNNFHKFTQNTHFTPTSFLSPQFVHLESSSHITHHHYPTHHHSPPKILQKSHKKLIFHKNSKIPFLTPHLT